MLATKKLPSEIIKEEGMEQVNDTGAIEKIVESVLVANPQAVADFKNGKTNEAVKVLKRDGFRSSVIEAMDACIKKSKSL